MVLLKHLNSKPMCGCDALYMKWLLESEIVKSEKQFGQFGCIAYTVLTRV